MKKCVVAGLACAAGVLWGLSAEARVVNYTGAGSVPEDLSDAANWEAEPTSDDVVWLDLSATGQRSFTFGADVAFGGLVVSNNQNQAVTFEPSAGLLTLGAEGLVCQTNGTLNLKTPIALSAEQTWQMHTTAINTYTNVSGTAYWHINESGRIRHYEPLGYGGRLRESSKGGTAIYGMGPLAMNLETRLGGTEGETAKWYYFSPTGTVRWADVFGGHTWSNLQTFVDGFICQRMTAEGGDGSYPYVIMDESEDEWYMSGWYRFGLQTGTLDMRAGSISNGNTYHFLVGEKLDNTTMTQCVLKVSGTANIAVTEISVGRGGQNDDPLKNPRVEQSGGTLNGKLHVLLTGSLDKPRAITDYVMSGGTLKAGIDASTSSDITTRGLGICSPAWNDYYNPAFFRMSGGELSAYQILFGTTTKTWSGVPKAQGEGYGVFELSGDATVNLPANGFQLAKDTKGNQVWNGGATTNAAYRISLRGGRIVGDRDYTMPLAMDFPPSETPFTWDTGSHALTLAGPLWGEGMFRKTGTGSLTLLDATRFHGKLEVSEGEARLMVDGAADSELEGDLTCYKWTADSLQLTDGAKVESWVDVNQGLVAGSNAQLNANFKFPTFTNNVFNGHAAVKILGRSGEQSLAVPPTQNPIAGKSKLTYVLVFRTLDSKNASGLEGIYGRWPFFGTSNYQGAQAMVAVSGKNQALFDFHRSGGDIGIGSREGYSLYDGKPHVVIATVDSPNYALMLDGWRVAAVKSGAQVTTKFDAQPLCFGRMSVDTGYNSKGTTGGCDVMLAEARVYAGRALTEAEQSELSVALFKKYRPEASDWLTYMANANTTIKGGMVPTTESVPDAPEADVVLTPAEMDELAAASGSTKPALVEKALYGKDVMRFNAADKTALQIPADESPLTGRSACAMAVVFRTTADGFSHSGVGWGGKGEGPTGIIGTHDNNSGKIGNLIGWSKEGTAFGYDTSTSRTLQDRRPCRLNDGLPHVAVYSFDGSASPSVSQLMVDGVYRKATDTKAGVARASLPFLIGQMDKGYGWFTGDIAEVRVWSRALSKDEMKALSAHVAAEYGFRLLPMTRFDDAPTGSYGLGAKEIEVKAGATLRMPLSTTAPFAVKPGQKLYGAGTFAGSYRFGDGAVLDLTGDVPEMIEDVQFAGGTWKPQAATAALPAFGRFAASGVVTVVLPDGEPVSRKRALATYETADIAPGTTCVVVPGEGAPEEGVLFADETTKVLCAKVKFGTLLIVR